MTLLTTENLKKYFGETRAVDGVTLTINQGEVLSLVGPNGAGKTTLVNLISGLIRPPDAGKILFQDTDVTFMPPQDRIRVGIARSFQIVNLFDQLTALDNIRLAIFSRKGKTKSLLRLAENDREVREEALEILDQFGIEDKRNIVAGGLAQGERKLLDVAVAYALRPTLLLLDEPTSGVSTRDKGKIMDTISGVVRSGQITAAIVEHDMDVVFTYSDRIVVMHQGKVLADGTPDEIRTNEEVTITLLGTSKADWSEYRTH
ncbi:MAG: ABC transporter ATP-binding protein [Nitrospinota bacterium]|nr:MAG: ABC transporter ATP-binding protein [Nitrospinota bacterium]